MKIITSLLIFGFVCFTHCAQFQTQPYQHPDYPGQCYDQEKKEPVPVGMTSNNSKGCKWQQCQADFRFIVSTCAPVGQPTCCTVSDPDYSKPYPKCCPQLICKDN